MRPGGFAKPRPRNAPLGRFCPAGRKARGTGCSNPPLLLPHKIRAKQKEQHPIRCCSWCDREDSNLWPSGSESYDAARNSMIYSDFLLVLHHYGTPNTSNIKQCVNDKNRPPTAKITAGGQLVVKKWSMRARYSAAFCLTVSPFHSGSRHNPLFAEFTDINAIYQFPIGQSFAQGNSDKEVI